ncbi:MAG: N-acetylmuramate alpha-1-phosphate uridylyltransferase MurU [Methylococcales bacterium]|jgi:MurNAc alpha-1-phosphate uridylyltransferase|nr:nucleotidyltransferase family protein [Methylococcaceae bacterium]
MKAMILAAGRGERMRPLTDHTPKPLLLAAGKPVIQYTIEQLVSAGFNDIVINTAHLGQQIKHFLGNGKQFNASICYSEEREMALETAGGIINALPLLGKKPFLVVNGDIANDYPFHQLHKQKIDLAHLVLIPNPEHHPAGDFHLAENQLLAVQGQPTLTYSGIGLYHPDLFKHTAPGKTKLAPLLRQAMAKNQVSGEKFNGFWMDIGTPERLKAMDEHYKHA